MNNLLDIHIDFNERMIKTDKRAVRFNTAWMMFNAAFLIFDCYSGINQGSIISQACIGAMTVNLFWTVCFLLVSVCELSESKRRLNFYKHRKEDKDVQDAIGCYEGAAQHYESLCNILKSQQDKQSNDGFVSTSDFSTVHS